MECLGMWNRMTVVLLIGCVMNAEVSAVAYCLYELSSTIHIIQLGSYVFDRVRVSNELGSGRSRTAKFSIMVVGTFSTLFGLVFALVLFLQRKQFPAIFSTDPEVKQLVDRGANKPNQPEHPSVQIYLSILMSLKFYSNMTLLFTEPNLNELFTEFENYAVQVWLN
ncbi:unnamed protein product [Coffea canephora]|uniref:Uncharacterized protein n=1 Tax=Coffea canephora TaxID=49390 RepID=A0A068UHQ2_COFCA|nr:unnamed protein product [Coffea canephora]